MKRVALFARILSALVLPLACSSTPPAPPRPLGDDSVPIADNVPVDAVRDEFGMVHIYATNVGDALRVMGYQMGRDRHVQLESPAPVSRNALPGGEVWDNASPYFSNEAERWRRNQNRPVWILKSDVIADAKERIAYDP